MLFPALIFSNLSRAQIETALFGQIFIIIILPTVLAGAIQWLGLFSPNISRATFTSMLQGAIRNNTPTGLVIAGLISPGQGVAVMALIMTVMIIINNIVCVTVLAHYGDKPLLSNSKKQSTFQQIIKNPLIIASAAGLGLNLLSIQIPDPLHNTLYFLGQTGLPLALMAVGAGLNLTAFSGKGLAISLPTFTKMILSPIFVYIILQFIDVPPTNAAMFILFAALPTAMASYVLASQMGGDKQTMAQIITIQALVTAITIPIVLLVINDLL